MTAPASPYVRSSAWFSMDRRYRYWLVRRWADGPRVVNFLMLNPSIAGAKNDDPTVRMCVAYAKRWGYAELIVTNLFAWIATDPGELSKNGDAVIGPENDKHLLEKAVLSDIIVCAWGTLGWLKGRGAAVCKLLRDAEQGGKLRVLQLTAGGHPHHPLRLRGDLDPILWCGYPEESAA